MQKSVNKSLKYKVFWAFGLLTLTNGLKPAILLTDNKHCFLVKNVLRS